MFSSDLKLIVFYSGVFGEKFIANLINYTNSCPSFGACGVDLCTKCKEGLYSFSDNIVAVFEMPDPKTLPQFIEDADKFLPKCIPKADIAIAINMHPDILLSLPKLLANNVKALIVPVEESKWCTKGLAMQIEGICQELGIEFAAPKPFCNLKPKDDSVIDRFVKEFGLGYPKFEIELVDNRIKDIRVLRSQPCGCAWYIAIRLKNFEFKSIRELWDRISEAHHSFPCIASMEIDTEYEETLLHVAGYIARHAVDEAIGYENEDIPENVMKFIL